MILVAYAFLILAVLAYSRGLIRPVSPRLALPVRALGALAGVAFAGMALLLLGEAPTVVGTAVLLLLAIGAAVYVWGLVRWRAPDRFVLRRTGWFSIVAALAVPSTLTLLMPVACLLVLTLGSAENAQTPFGQLAPPARR